MPTESCIRQSYIDFVKLLFKEMDTPSASLMHAGIGIDGEAGELLDTLKKHWVYNKPLDYDNIEEEMGDMLFYFVWLMQYLELDLEKLLRRNEEKLGLRYPDGRYTDAHAQARLDKQEEQGNLPL